ncbi:MAG: NTP transferase domain-containing protein [Deltaproteobacteria bacterium]|nr:NTP transferase domain-containing protein [Deltaproteobacteria bacterium]
MKGVLLAGGSGSRLYPLTKVTNKHLLPVGRKPMIFHPIEKMLEAGITDILVVTGTEHMGAVVGLLGSGAAFSCRFTYRVQDQPGGIAEALGLAQDFVGSDRCLVILGDNIFADSLQPFVQRFEQQSAGARILLKEVDQPQRFGVVHMHSDRITRIIEKPTDPPSNLAVTGIYFYDSAVFDIIETLKPSSRGELEITDVNNAYLKRGQLEHDILEGWWTDAGTFETLALATQLVSE